MSRLTHVFSGVALVVLLVLAFDHLFPDRAGKVLGRHDVDGEKVVTPVGR